MSRPILYQAISEGLASRLNDDPSYQPPSIVSLSREYGVAYRTMLKAVEELEQKGVLQRWRGRRVMRAGQRTAAEDTHLDERSPSFRLYEKLKDRILNGAYRTGHPLPKYLHLLRTEKVTSRTLRNALRALTIDKLVHKEGIRWIAGPAQPDLPGTTIVYSPMRQVMILANQEVSTQYFFYGSMFAPFVQNLNAEFLHHGVHATVVYKNPPADRGESVLDWGQEQARQKITEWGDRYLGALVIDTYPVFADQKSWAPTLSLGGTKPIVYFDYTKSDVESSRTTLQLPKVYYRLISDQERAVELALRHLHAAGHRTIGSPYVSFPGYSGWMPGRCEMVKTIAAHLDPPCRIVPADNAEPFWNLEIRMQVATNFRAAVRTYCFGAQDRSGSQQVRSRSATIFRKTPSMTNLLEQGVTAIVAPNDHFAHEYYLWCKEVGIEIPRQLSLIGFDNVPESATYPIATVDWGFARLGYLAAHILIGDIPVSTDKEGTIRGIPVLIDRGSIGPPSKGYSHASTTGR